MLRTYRVPTASKLSKRDTSAGGLLKATKSWERRAPFLAITSVHLLAFLYEFQSIYEFFNRLEILLEIFAMLMEVIV